MTSLSNRPNTALVVVDVQNDVVALAHDRDGVIANINTLVERARAVQAPVVWVQHNDEDLPSGSDGWQYVPELERRENEPLVHKQYRDSFEDTTMEAELAALGVGRLIVTGAQTDYCVRSTLHGAVVRGYDAFLVSDAHTTDDYSEASGLPAGERVVAHLNTDWATHEAPGRAAGIVTTADVKFDTL